MKTLKLAGIIVAVPIVLLIAVPILRESIVLLWFNPYSLSGTFLQRSEVAKVVSQHPDDWRRWLAYAECAVVSQPERPDGTVYIWDQSWSPEEPYQRAMSLAGDSAVPHLRYALYRLDASEAPELDWDEYDPTARSSPLSSTEKKILDDAESALRRAQERDPDNAACDYLLAYIHLIRRDEKQAFEMCRSAIEKLRWDAGSRQATEAVLDLLTAAYDSALDEVFAWTIGASVHAYDLARHVGVTLARRGELFRNAGEHEKAILCFEAAVHLGHLLREEGYWLVDGLVAIPITGAVSGSFISEQERQKVAEEITVSEVDDREDSAWDLFDAIKDRDEEDYRKWAKEWFFPSEEERRRDEQYDRQLEKRRQRYRQIRIKHFAAYLRQHGRADLARRYRRELPAAYRWRDEAGEAADREPSLRSFLYNWPRYARVLWMMSGFLLGLGILVMLMSVAALYWREQEPSIRWPWLQWLLLGGLLVAVVPLFSQWRELHVYSIWYPYPIYLPAAVKGISGIIGAWLILVLALTLFKRSRTHGQGPGLVRTYLASLRHLVPLVFAVVFLASVVSLWPARQTVERWNAMTRAKIHQGEVEYYDIGVSDADGNSGMRPKIGPSAQNQPESCPTHVCDSLSSCRHGMRSAGGSRWFRRAERSSGEVTRCLHRCARPVYRRFW